MVEVRAERTAGSFLRKDLAPVQKPRSLVVAPLRALQKNRVLVSNAASLYVTTIINSVLGFGFWTVAARAFTVHQVGYGSAAISAMSILSTAGMFGLNTLLIGELPRRKSRGGLISAAVLAAATGSFILAAAFAFIAPLISSNFTFISNDALQLVVFVSGVTVIGASLVLDEATIGLLRGRLQLWRNLVFTISKLLFLPLAALFMRDKFGVGIVASWVAGAVFSLTILAMRLLVSGELVFPKPDWRVLKGLGRLTVIHNWLNLAIMVPWMLLPVLVTITLGPTASAAFYIAWTLSTFLRVIPIHLSTVLFAVTSKNTKQLAPQLRFSLRTCMLVGVPGMAVMCLGSHLILNIFGASYSKTGAVSLILLSVAYLPSVPKAHYIAVCRATGQLSRAATIISVTALLEIVSAVIGAKQDGLTGFGVGVLVACLFEAVITTPQVLRATSAGQHRKGRGQGTHRRPARGN